MREENLGAGSVKESPKAAKSNKGFVKRPLTPKSQHFVDNSELLLEIAKSKQRLKENPSLAQSAITRRLMDMLILMVDRYATKPNWAGYSYIDDMKSDAVLDLYQKWHRFDETRFDNPFAYYTQIMYHCFIGSQGKEKRQREIRDRQLERLGRLPSYTRQLEHEQEMRDAHEAYDAAEPGSQATDPRLGIGGNGGPSLESDDASQEEPKAAGS
jgi:DNA-directed RNA polymerase specialized sigma24 family protein